MGETLRRLACKLGMTLVNEDVIKDLKPFQLGLGTPNGSEAIVHSVAAIIENLENDEAILQLSLIHISEPTRPY